jgi:hypothetical protein
MKLYSLFFVALCSSLALNAGKHAYLNCEGQVEYDDDDDDSPNDPDLTFFLYDSDSKPSGATGEIVIQARKLEDFIAHYQSPEGIAQRELIAVYAKASAMVSMEESGGSRVEIAAAGDAAYVAAKKLDECNLVAAIEGLNAARAALDRARAARS